MNHVRIYLVAAMGANRVIGNGPDIPWKIPGEQKIFRALTEGKVVVMGRKTFESIGKPLPNRHTIVISRQTNYLAAGCTVATTLAQAIAIAAETGHELYVAGGAEIYALAMPHAHGIFLTEVHQSFDGDAFFPKLDETDFELVSSETIQAAILYTYSVYVRRNGWHVRLR
jgi:dihydrofolate reductase (trimethoprim resistance protein)